MIVKKDNMRNIKAAEMWFFRRLLRIKWTDKITNESVLNELSTCRQMLKLINKRSLSYICPIDRSKTTDLMFTAIMGKVKGERKPGKPPTSFINITKYDWTRTS